MAMKIPFTHTLWRPCFIECSIILGLSISCSSSDEAPRGGRVEHPMEPRPKTGSASPASASPPSSVLPLPPPSQSASSLAEIKEPPLEHSISPMDKTIVEDCPERAWSKNVPKRACTKDEECGDGFCDRKQCASIWTCHLSYGQRCEGDHGCSASYHCIEGRCRSCASDAECIGARGMQDPKCVSSPFIPGAHECRGLVPGFVGTIPTRAVPQGPKK